MVNIENLCCIKAKNKNLLDQGWREVPHESKRQEILQQMHEKSIGYHLCKSNS